MEKKNKSNGRKQRISWAIQTCVKFTGSACKRMLDVLPWSLCVLWSRVSVIVMCILQSRHKFSSFFVSASYFQFSCLICFCLFVL